MVVGSFDFARKSGFDFSKLPCRLYDIAGDIASRIKIGKISAASGESSYRYILKTVELVSSGDADAIVTAPISKEALKISGHDFEGHTELLAKLTHTKDFAMLMSAGKMNVVMVTRHTAVSEIGKKLSSAKIFTAARLAENFLRRSCGIKKPRVAVLALNPHAGESGLMGNEERSVIIPAIKKLVSKGIDAAGPLPSDSAWLKMKKNKFDLMVAMYHDQAMIGFKIISPESLVNVTVGLPFLRTSPGHGTAVDIAGRNVADPSSMAEAIKFAAKYC
jgi:4-hydroxythreonine-4-phosphate dehydrogenase